MVLCDIEGLTYEEVADVLDIKLGTVRSRIHRGRAQLRTALAHRDPALRGEQPEPQLVQGARRRPALRAPRLGAVGA